MSGTALPPRKSRQQFIEVLAHHALAEIRCDHEAETDVAVCNCALWASEPMPSVQAAKEAWAEHVWQEFVRPAMEVCGL